MSDHQEKFPKDIWRWGPLYLFAGTVCLSISAGTIATGLCLMAGAGALMLDRRKSIWPTQSVLLASCFLAGSYFLATLLSTPYPPDWGKFAEELWIKLLLVAIPLSSARYPGHVIRALKLLMIVGTVAGGYALVQHFLGEDPIRGQSIYRPQFGHSAVSGFFSHHLSYAGQVMILLILASAYLWDRKSRTRSLVVLLPVVVMMAALVLTFARSAWLGAMAGLLVLSFFPTGKARLMAWGTALVLLVGIFISPVTRGHFWNIFDSGKHLTRLNLWESSWLGIKANPLLGMGPGNFEFLLAEYQVPGHYDTLGHAHHDLLMHGVNAGFPAMLAALFLLATTCCLAWKSLNLDRSWRWAFSGTLAIQAGITVAGFFQVFQTDDEVEMILYFILGCTLALAAGHSATGEGSESAH